MASRTKALQIVAMALLWVAVGCSQKVDFTAGVVDNIIPVTKTSEQQIALAQFRMGKTQHGFDQASFDDNRTSVSFQVTNGEDTINNLQAQDIVLTENDIPISQFLVNSNSQQFVQTVDIVIALDVTGSMSPTIESAKNRVTNFIRDTRAAGYHTRMCLVTFGDYTVQKCNKFYDNNPNDPATISQVEELISEVAKLRALKGDEDPGGRTFDENPLSAIIDSSIAPWAPGSQRFMIAITDARFLYSPSNQGEIGDLAPNYSDAITALQTSQMNLFLVAPSAGGYNSSFFGLPSLVSASNGEFFLFNDLVNGVITLDTVLNRIIQRVRTTYTINFTVDEIPGLDPTQPLEKRSIKVNLANGTVGTVKIINVSTNLPNGKPEKKKQWKLTDKQIDLDTLRVLVNGTRMTQGFHIDKGEIVFDSAPAMGARIEVEFSYKLLKDALLFQPITLSANEDINSLHINLNATKATGKDLVLERSIEGTWSIRPSDWALSENDPFDIRGNNGLNIQVLKIVTE